MPHLTCGKTRSVHSLVASTRDGFKNISVNFPNFKVFLVFFANDASLPSKIYIYESTGVFCILRGTCAEEFLFGEMFVSRA